MSKPEINGMPVRFAYFDGMNYLIECGKDDSAIRTYNVSKARWDQVKAEMEQQ